MIFGQQPKSSTETRVITVDLGSAMNAGDSLSSASVTSAVWSGTDTSPSAVISGAASVSGTKITQKVTGGVNGNIYLLTFTGTATSGATPKGTMYLAVIDNPV